MTEIQEVAEQIIDFFSGPFLAYYYCRILFDFCQVYMRGGRGFPRPGRLLDDERLDGLHRVGQ